MMRSPPVELAPAKLDSCTPWSIFSTKALSAALEINPGAFGLRRYRGVGPAPVPQEWLHGHVVGFLIADVRSWLGDQRDENQQFRAALGFVDPTESDDVVRLLTRAAAETSNPLVGAEFSNTGKLKYLNYLWRRF